jgi:hypothetical protein
MESLHFNTMVKSYTTHFATYNINKNKWPNWLLMRFRD